MAYTEHQIIHERGDRHLNTDTYQSALESTKDSIEDVNKAIGFSLGSLTLEKLITSAITLVICIVCIWIIMRIARRISSHSRLSESLSRFILKVLKITLEFMAILIVADSLGFNVTALLAVFSLLGLALSLSVQSCLSNAIILLTRPFEDGDFIEAGNVSGTVRDIGLIYTQLCTIDNKDIYVPNSDLSASKIVNYNREPQRRVDLTFGADYTCRPEQVKAALHNAVSLVPGILPEPAPFVRVSGYGESNIDYVVRVWCKTADYWTVYYDLMEAVGAAFDAHGVSMSYPQMNVHVLDTPESAKKD